LYQAKHCQLPITGTLNCETAEGKLFINKLGIPFNNLSLLARNLQLMFICDNYKYFRMKINEDRILDSG
jgi:hypothetical protein